VQSLERALDILEVLGRSDGELGISEIGLSVGLANGTVHRLLSTLTRRGYARQVSDSRKYTLGPRAITLASSSRERLGPLARPFLRELMEVRMFTEPGNRVPAHASGTGKVLLAFQPPEALKAMLGRSGLARFTPHTITDMDRFLEELELIRERGYATDYEEIEEGVRCVAAPVSGAEGRVVAAISISGPAGRLEGDRLEEIVPQIKRIAADLSRSLGSQQ
jgi:IclR family acetate operon transcriptional repressor